MTGSMQRISRRSSLGASVSIKPTFPTTYQRRQPFGNDFHSSRNASIPLLVETMNQFCQATRQMEEEILLPLRLKDLPVEELIFDNSIQPDNWHELYSFIREIRNQLSCNRPFANEENQTTPTQPMRKNSIDDEGIILIGQDNLQFSSASSTTSSEELEQSSTSSQATSYKTAKDDLKQHYYGLLASLNNLTTMANRVTEKYREEFTF